MLYFVVLVYIAAAYVRPGEVVSGLAAYPVIDILSGLALALAAGSLALDFRPFWREPLDKAVLVYALIIVISNPAWGYFQGGTDAFFKFIPVLVCYFLIRIAVRTRRHLSGIATLFVYLNVFLAVNGILQAYTGLGFGGVEILDTREGARIRGTGIFNDPNDLGMTLVMGVPFLLAIILERERGFFRRFMATIWFGVIVFACYLTNSRGTMLGLGAVMLTYAYRRFGGVVAGLVGIVGVAVLLLFGPSRTASISAEEGSAQGRIQAWISAYEMMRESPLLGVGFGRFIDYHERVAHNSFAHTIGELGLIGAVTFVAMFYWYFRRLRLRPPPDPPNPENDRWARTLSAAGIGMVVCMGFLSRQYTMFVYILLAMGASHAALIREHQPAPSSAVERIAAIGLGLAMIPAFYVVTRLLVQFD